MVTKKLYLADMYARETDAVVAAVEKNRVILDRTVFYAESGGQLGDTGFINQIRVVDTQKKNTKETRILTHADFPSINVNTDVVHILDEDAQDLKPGDRVKAVIDWERRYAIMRLHSATHVVWHFVERELDNPPLKGCLIGPDKSRLDFGVKIDPDVIPELTRLSNAFIREGHSIRNVPLEEQPEALFWICGDVKIPCGGTHVNGTNQIGSVSLKRRSQGEKLDRLYISLTDQVAG